MSLETNSYTGDVHIDGITKEMAYAIEEVMVGKMFVLITLEDKYNLPQLPEMDGVDDIFSRN